MATQSIRPALRNNSEALARATTGLSMSNYPTIYGGFMAKGIPESEIKPRERLHLQRLAGARPSGSSRRARRQGGHLH